MYIDEDGDLSSYSVGDLLALPCKHCGAPAGQHELGDIQMYMSGGTTCSREQRLKEEKLHG